MKPRFKTLREIKQHLPEVLARIKTCRAYAEIEARIMHAGMVERTNWLTQDTPWYGSDGLLRESYRNSILYDMEADWLQSQVDRLRGVPEI